MNIYTRKERRSWPTSGFHLKVLREYKNISQRYVASKLGVSQQNYSKLEVQNYVHPDRVTEVIVIIGSDYAELDSVMELCASGSGEYRIQSGSSANILQQERFNMIKL